MDPLDLQSDCENCLGLCCIAPPFAQSDEFAYSKAEGEPCRNLDANNRCTIHDDLKDQGFTGCIKFECFGAGQKVTHHHFKGQSWRQDHLTAKRLFHVFFIVKALHRMIQQMIEKDQKHFANSIKDLEKMSLAGEDDLIALDLASLKEEISISVSDHAAAH